MLLKLYIDKYINKFIYIKGEAEVFSYDAVRTTVTFLKK